MKDRAQARWPMKALWLTACGWLLGGVIFIAVGLGTTNAQTQTRKSPSAETPLPQLAEQLVRLRSAFDAKDWSSVIAITDILLAANPNDYAALIMRSVVLNELKRYREALSFAERVIAQAPEDRYSLAVLCSTQVMVQLLDDAKKSCAKAIRLAPHDIIIVSENAFLHLAEGDETSARLMFDRVIPLLTERSDLEGVLRKFDEFERYGWQVSLTRQMRNRFKDQGDRVLNAQELWVTVREISAGSEGGALLNAEAALAEARQALSSVDELLGPDSRMSGSGLLAISLLEAYAGNHDAASKTALRANDIVARADPEGSSRLFYLARAFGAARASLQGQYGEAIEQAKAARELAIRLEGPDDVDTLTAESVLANVYSSINACELAIAIHERHLAIRERRVGGAEGRGAAQSLEGMGRCLVALMQPARARPLLQRALAIRLKLGESGVKALQALSHAESQLGQSADAITYQERAVQVLRVANGLGSPETIRSVSWLGLLYDRTGQTTRALQLHTEALQAAETVEDPLTRFVVSFYAAAHFVIVGDRASAIFLGKRSVSALQGVRAGSASLDRNLADRFEDGIAPVYQLLAELLVQDGRLVEAEQVTAMLKDREYFELTRQSSTAAAGRAASMSGAEIAMNRQMDELRQAALAQANELDALKRKLRQEKTLSPDDERRRDQLVEAQSAWGRDFQRFMAALQPALAKEPADAQRQRDAIESGARSPLMRVLRDAQAEKGSQRPVAVTYIVAEESLSILVTTPEAVFARRVNANRKELFERIARLRAILQRPDLDPRPAAQALYQTLIAPIEGDLAALKADFILLNLNGMLRYIPFAALHDGKQYLVQRWPLALYTSAGNTQVQAATTASWRVQGFGMTQAATVQDRTFKALELVPDELAAVVRTVKTPQGALPGRLDMDESFTRKSFERALASANSGDLAVMHIASHFNVAIGSDDLTFLLLGDVKPLLLRDLKNMDFRGVQLLVLSACDTATPAGRNESGSEIEGMAAAAQLAGARSVLATLWPVADESTAALMRRFYQIRIAPAPGGMTHALALRRAQLDLIEGQIRRPPSKGQRTSSAALSREDSAQSLPRVSIAGTPQFNKKSNDDLSHPYYWAPFVLMGNWL